MITDLEEVPSGTTVSEERHREEDNQATSRVKTNF